MAKSNQMSQFQPSNRSNGSDKQAEPRLETLPRQGSSKGMVDVDQEAQADNSGSDEEGVEGDGDDNEWDDWQEETKTETYSLIIPAVLLPSIEQALEHDLLTHGFCVKSLIRRLRLNTLGRIKLINWIRAGQSYGRSKAEIEALNGKERWIVDDSDEWLLPRLPADGMLQYDFEEEDEEENSDESTPASGSSPGHPTSTGLAPDSSNSEITRLCAEVERLRHENNRTRQLLKSTASLVEDDHVQKTPLGHATPKAVRDDDTHYFSSYAHEGIHWTMIQDEVRTDSYRHFIQSNPSVFKNKRVLDIGCGTGILSFFAAQAGAKKVYAIDASQIALNAVVNMKSNGIAEVVKVINKKVENLDLQTDLEGEPVDVIISEWMGYACLYEVFLPSVLIARDRFLKPGGLMGPSQCSILMAGWGDERWWTDKVAWWDNNKYNFKMGESMTERMFKEGLIEDFPSAGIITPTTCLRDVLTSTMPSDIKDCISFSQPFTLICNERRKFYGFLIWFDTFFTQDGRPIDSLALENNLDWKREVGEVGFSTSAKAVSTHWHQTLLLLKNPFEVTQETKIEGTSTWSVDPDNGRELEITVMWRVQLDSNSEWGPYEAQVWTV